MIFGGIIWWRKREENGTRKDRRTELQSRGSETGVAAASSPNSYQYDDESDDEHGDEVLVYPALPQFEEGKLWLFIVLGSLINLTHAYIYSDDVVEEPADLEEDDTVVVYGSLGNWNE